MEERTPSRPPPSIELHPDEKWTARAFSRMRGDVGEIHVHEGTYTLLADFFLRALAHRRNFPTIGNPASELIDAPTLQDLYSDVDHLLGSGPRGEDELQIIRPQCPIRATAAMHLTDIALDAIVLHEATHIYHGHHALLSQPAQLSREQQQCLELDADEGATSLALALLGQDALKRREERRVLAYCASHGDVARLLTMAVHSSALLHIEFIRSGQTFTTHPRVRDRQAVMVLAILGFYSNKHMPDSLADEIRGSVLNAVADCEAAYVHVTGKDSEASSAASAIFEHEFLDTFKTAWREVRPMLEPLTYVPLPPVQPI